MYSNILLFAGCLAIYTVIYSHIFGEKERGTGSGKILFTMIALWALGYAYEIRSIELSEKILMHFFSYLCSIQVPFLFLVFVTRILDLDFFPWKSQLLLGVIPFLMVPVVLTNDIHGLVWSSLELNQGTFTPLIEKYSLGYIVITVYNYILLILATTLFIRVLKKKEIMYFKHVSALLFTLSLAFISYNFYLFNQNVNRVDLTPLALVIATQIIAIINPNRLHRRDLIPAARNSVFEIMSDIMLLVDKDFYLYEWNNSAYKFFSGLARDISIETILPGIVPHITSNEEKFEFEVPFEGDSRIYEVNQSNLEDLHGDTVSKVLLFHDITRRKKDKEELQKYSQYLENILSASPDAIIVTNINGLIVECNHAALAMQGSESKKDLIGRHVTEFLAVDDLSILRSNMQLLYDQKKGNFEMTLIKLNGDTFPADVSVSPLRDQNNEFTGYIAIIKDDTIRKKFISRLTQSEKLYRDLAENAADILLTMDLQGFFTYVSKAMEPATGYTPDDLVGRHIGEFLAPKSLELASERIQMWMKGSKKLAPYNIWMKAKNGELVAFELATSAIHEDEKLVGVQIIARDLSERIKHEGQLEALYSHVSQLSKAQTKREVALITINTVEDVMGYSFCSFGLVEGDQLRHIDNRDDTEDFVLSLGGSGISVRVVKTGVTQLVNDVNKDPAYVNGSEGSNTIQSEMVIPVFGNGKVVAVINAESDELNDFTDDDVKIFETLAVNVGVAYERLRYVESLEDLVEEKTMQLRDAERMAAIGETAAMVGHDLRNPLQALVGLISILKLQLYDLQPKIDKELTSIFSVTFDKVEDQILYMNKIVADLQDLTRSINVQPATVELNQIVNEVLSEVKVPSSIEIENCVGEVNIDVDALLFNRVLTNLILNAFQAMPMGGTLTFKVKETSESTELKIIDTGIGIPEEAMERIFTPLYTTKAKGTGLGLPVCKKIMESHRGSITVESREMKGTTFTLSVPKKTSEHPEDKEMALIEHELDSARCLEG